MATKYFPEIKEREARTAIEEILCIFLRFVHTNSLFLI